MILLEQVLHLRISGCQRICLLLHYLVGIQFASRLGNLAAQLHISDIIADTPTLYRFYDGSLKRVERFELLAVLHQYHVITHRTKERFTHLTGSKRICHILKFLECLRWGYPGQFTTTGGRTFILRDLLCHLCEVGPTLQCTIYRIHALFDLFLLLGCGLSRQSEQDMCRTYQALGANHCLSTIVHLTCFGQHIGIGNHCGTYLLVAIHLVFLTERRECIEFSIESSCHLQFVVNKQGDILINRQFINHPFAVVLVERVFKLRTWHGDTVDSHHCRIG